MAATNVSAIRWNTRGAECNDERLGLIILNAFGRVIRMTAAAFAMAREGLFSTEQGFLRFAQPQAMTWLDAQVARLRLTPGESFSPPLTWESPGQCIALSWWPFRWSERPGGDPEGLLVIREPERGARPSPLLRVCSGLGLTGAETEIVIRLTKGELVKQIAAARGTSVSTVRSQLRVVFQKTGTAKQLHLVQHVLRQSGDTANDGPDKCEAVHRRPPPACSKAGAVVKRTSFTDQRNSVKVPSRWT